MISTVFWGRWQLCSCCSCCLYCFCPFCRHGICTTLFLRLLSSCFIFVPRYKFDYILHTLSHPFAFTLYYFCGGLGFLLISIIAQRFIILIVVILFWIILKMESCLLDYHYYYFGFVFVHSNNITHEIYICALHILFYLWFFSSLSSSSVDLSHYWRSHSDTHFVFKF